MFALQLNQNASQGAGVKAPYQSIFLPAPDTVGQNLSRKVRASLDQIRDRSCAPHTPPALRLIFRLSRISDAHLFYKYSESAAQDRDRPSFLRCRQKISFSNSSYGNTETGTKPFRCFQNLSDFASFFLLLRAQQTGTRDAQLPTGCGGFSVEKTSRKLYN